MHQESLTLSIQGKIVIIQPKDSEEMFNQLTLPLQCSYLTTSYFRILSSTSEHITHETQVFASFTWEIMNILKENFPSKILLYQEGLDHVMPQLTISSGEELRRQISCMLSLKDENRQLVRDELEDVWHTLRFAERLNDHKGTGLCLELILAQVEAMQDMDEGVLARIMSKQDLTALDSNKALAQEIITKYTAKHQDAGLDAQSLQSSASEQSKDKQQSSTRVALFQLSESNDLSRVTQTLKSFASKAPEQLSQITQKYQLSHKLIGIVQKYCQCDYGFENQSSKTGVFQYYFVKLMIILAGDYAVFLEFLQGNILDSLSQLVEEGVILSYNDSRQCHPTPADTTDLSFHYRFMYLALDFMDLTVTRHFAEYIPSVRECLQKVYSRFERVVSKKEGNMLLIRQIKGGERYGKESVEEELREASEQLLAFRMAVGAKLQRVQGLNDSLFDNHEDKYAKLFPLLAKKGAILRSADQTRAIPQKHGLDQLPTFNCGGAMMIPQQELDDSTNQENMHANVVYIKKHESAQQINKRSDNGYQPSTAQSYKSKINVSLQQTLQGNPKITPSFSKYL
ncbi:hypothetical protein FGO68_gene6543 [Halteria grandinella]|uniref:Uncharacterized protein n=1 Tax=Halteria grandinella TaxID=5974 RepID=A0A8J8NH64_HALGN|nr:hypothetical protein FGO68_gene6543 [Halteria grandinella]